MSIAREHRTPAPVQRAASTVTRARAASMRGAPAAVRALQRTAGNAAVSATLQRYVGPTKPTPITPQQDPRFKALTGKLSKQGAGLKSHPTPKAEAKKAADAAVAPAADKEAQAKATQTEAMSGAKPGAFDKAAFVAQVKAAVAAKAPKNLDEADKFGDSGKAGEVKAEVGGKVAEGKAKAAQDINDKTTAAPDQSKAVEKEVKPLAPEKEPAPPSVDAGAAMPAKAPSEQTDLSGGPKAAEGAMAEANVNEDQLAKSNEPEFTGAVAEKKKGEEHSAAAPEKFRESEAEKLAATKQQAAGTAKAGLGAMLGAKKSMLAKAATNKTGEKAKEEQERARITKEIQGIFDKTKTEVTGILDGLDDSVAKRFEAGEKQARDAFTADHKRRMDAYKDDRYSGLIGAGRWIRDKFAGLPAEANNIYQESKKLYEAKMETCIGTVADFIGAELTRAKDKIAEGRTKIKDYVAQQPKNLQKFAGETAGKFTEQFDQLESDVDSKKDALAEDLATKYDESRKAVDAEIEEMQEANKGLWDKAIGAIAGVIKTILQLKDMLLGVLARAANAIGKIIKDPIGFLGNFVNAVKTGITNFASNIVEHLKTGLKGWLFGALASAGIELPEKFDLPGIIKLVLSILGLTWANIRARITKHIPEAIMDKVEKGVEFIQIVLKDGLGGIWKWVMEKVGDLKEMVMAQIQDFVITKIIKAGITWLISMLNPAAAFIKACKMIYDVVMFFVEKGSQIKEFVDSVLDSVESIASGGVGAVAGLIEKTLAKTLPLVLGFLASLLGLGGISEKIKSILETVQKPVMSVVDKLVGGAVKYGKKLMNSAKNLGKKALGKVTAGATKLKDKALAKIRGGDDSPEGKQKRLDAGMSAGVALADRLGRRPIGEQVLRPGLQVIRARYGLSLLQPEAEGARWAIHGEIQRAKVLTSGKTPTASSPDSKDVEGEPAPGVGRIGSHGSKPPSLRKGPAIHHLESEHIIPFAVGKRLWQVVNLAMPGRKGHEDKEQTTIMIYKGAADRKTAGDSTLWDGFEAAVERAQVPRRLTSVRTALAGGLTSARTEGVELVGLLMQGVRVAMEDAIARTNSAITQEAQDKTENSPKTNAQRRAKPGQSEPPTPDAKKVAKAANLQFDDVVSILKDVLGDVNEGRTPKITPNKPRGRRSGGKV